MNLEVIKNAVTSKIARQILISQKHSPTILFVGGVIGVVATTVMASRATLKLEEVLNEHDHKLAWRVTELNRRETAEIHIRTALQIGRLYAPSVIVGAASIAALTGSHITLTRRNVALTAAYSALDKGFNEYRKRVRDEFGEEKERELRYGTEEVREVVEGEDGSDVVTRKVLSPAMPSIYAKFFDDGSVNWSREPEYNLIFLNAQQNYANDLLRSRGHVFLNEVYDMLGLPRTKAGAVVGWVLSKEGDNFVDFGIYEKDSWKARQFVNGLEGSILLDFNVDGVILDLI